VFQSHWRDSAGAVTQLVCVAVTIRTPMRCECSHHVNAGVLFQNAYRGIDVIPGKPNVVVDPKNIRLFGLAGFLRKLIAGFNDVTLGADLYDVRITLSDAPEGRVPFLSRACRVLKCRRLAPVFAVHSCCVYRTFKIRCRSFVDD
jgi:hypothetical protein